MFRRHERRHITPINTTSTADISFILLIFFLVMTSMDADKGLLKQLPPIDNKDRQETVEVSKDNLLELKITADNRLTLNGKPFDIKNLKGEVARFVARKDGRHSHVIALDVDRSASYEAYFNVQNEITAAYNTLRDNRAKRIYGQSYTRCGAEQRRAIREYYPQRIAETYTHTEKGGAE